MPELSRGIRSIATNACYSVAARLLNIGLRLVWVVLLARLLDLSDYALLAYALSWYVLFMPLTNLGQDLELARAVGGRSDDAEHVVSATFTLRLYTTSATLALVATLGWLLNPGDGGRVLLLLTSMAMLPRSLAVWCHTVFIVSEQTHHVLRQDLIFRPLEVIAAVAVLLAGGDAIAVALVHVGAWTLHAAASVLRVRRRLFRFRLLRRIPRWRMMLGYGSQIGISRVIEDWLLNGPVILFRHLSDDLGELAVLAFCMQLQNLIRILPKTLTSAAMPVLGRALKRGSDGPQRFLLMLGTLATALGGLLAALLLGTGDTLIEHSVGAAFAAAADYLPGVCWLAVLPVLGGAAQKVTGLQGHAGTVLVSSLVGGLVLSLASWLLTPALGIVGVLLAAVSGSLLWTLGMTRRMGAVALRYAALTLGTAVAALLALAAEGQLLALGAPAALTLGASLVVLLALLGWRLERRPRA